MNLKTLTTILRRHHPVTSIRVARLLTPFYRVSFLASAKANGLLGLLARGPVPRQELLARYPRDPRASEALEAWLDFGVTVGALELGSGGYSLRGLARKLATEAGDPALALLEEAVWLHHPCILSTPRKVELGELWTLADQDGEMIARSSRTLAAYVEEAIDMLPRRRDDRRLLEIGCGSGAPLRYALECRPELHAVAFELQPRVAEMARQNMATWGLKDRVEILCSDVRDQTPDRSFDLVTLHNCIYYFELNERAALMRHIRGFLRDGGSLLLTTGCHDGGPIMDALNLWGASTRGCGRLPFASEVHELLRAAHFADIEARSLVPGTRYLAFVARAT